ncbi:hypothetical protein GGI07_002913 [Coemansia sp. Benny D115]|nr:hypothetical protein GGI07_002913 [Coemansia sp. Benny D115]
MDLNLVCGPCTASPPLPSTHELESIRASLIKDTTTRQCLSPPCEKPPASSTPTSVPLTPPQSAPWKQTEAAEDPADLSPCKDARRSVSGEQRKQARVSILEKYKNELREVAEKCKILSQFAEQYGPEKNKFNAQPSDDLVIDMARKAYEVLMVFMTIRRERMSTSVDNDTMEYIRKRRTMLSPARTKTRKRSKRADTAQSNTCRSCGISETPEWRRGPDGARTLCNACGLHYAKLNKKRANEGGASSGDQPAQPSDSKDSSGIEPSAGTAASNQALSLNGAVANGHSTPVSASSGTTNVAPTPHTAESNITYANGSSSHSGSHCPHMSQHQQRPFQLQQPPPHTHTHTHTRHYQYQYQDQASSSTQHNRHFHQQSAYQQQQQQQQSWSGYPYPQQQQQQPLHTSSSSGPDRYLQNPYSRSAHASGASSTAYRQYGQLTHAQSSSSNKPPKTSISRILG